MAGPGVVKGGGCGRGFRAEVFCYWRTVAVDMKNL